MSLFPKKVVVAVDLSNNMEETLAPLAKLHFIKGAELHFVHIFKTISYPVDLDFSALLYPKNQDLAIVGKAVIEKLSATTEKVLPLGQSGAVKLKCIFSEKPNTAFCEYALDEKADLLIIAPRKQKGIFESSFANYVTRHSDVPVLMLK